METKKLHLRRCNFMQDKNSPDPSTDARAVPIYQLLRMYSRNSAHAAARFALQEPGNIYGRLTIPHKKVFEQRVRP